MTDNDKSCPPAKEVEDFLFKQASIGQICDGFPSVPINANLIAADGKRGLLYIGYENKLIVTKPGVDTNPEWKFELDLPDKVCRIALSCDCSFLAITFSRPSALIYDASSLHRQVLDLLHEIRLSTGGGNVIVSDLKWNPAIPEMLCSITSDHTVGCFQVSRDRKAGVQILGMEKVQGLEALCVSWSPKGKQLVVGCKNGDIVQLKPELKVARHLPGPTPNEGPIISMLWVSNYQFCACYFHTGEQRVSVMIVDAPKGTTVPTFTNYEDITFGTGPLDNLVYYFEHIAEWGVIIAASSHSSEVAVLGTADNGITWNQYNLVDDSTAQLPLNRKKGIENYPVGVVIDKSSAQKLPWGSESTLPNPVPILKILVTSGQLCCFHMVNLKPNTPAICAAPTENIPAPAVPRPSIGPTDVSFNLPQGATSTPRSKQAAAIAAAADSHADRPKLTTNLFEDKVSSSFSFLAPGNKNFAGVPAQPEIKSTGFAAPTEIKTGGLFGQGDGKSNLFQQEMKINKPAFGMPEPVQQIKQPMPTLQQPTAQPQFKPAEPSLNYQVRSEFKVPEVNAQPPQVEHKIQNEKPSGPPPTYQASQETKSTQQKDTPPYDENLCLRAYYEEHARFEKELKNRQDNPSWNCGTEEERQLLIKKSDEIDEFLRELRETTNSLASDIAYLKALLLQSFAWIEESKSKNSANVSVTGSRNRDNKLADLQRLYYYTQSQLIQATKVLDLEWAEHNNREFSKMKIPSLEVIYQSLIRYSQIIAQEKKNLDDLTRKWRAIARGGAGNANSSLTILDRSMASLNLSHNSSVTVSDTAIDLRCKFIANNTKNFSREKQMKLRDLLSESAPRIVRAVRPTAVQDRLEATLSSLASLKTAETTPKSRTTKSVLDAQQKVDISKSPMELPKPKTHNPLSSLDNLVSGIGGGSPGGLSLSKSPSSTTPFSSFGTKPSFVPSAAPQFKAKENIGMSFGQAIMSHQAQTAAIKSFGKMDSISFGSPVQHQQTPQKLPELQAVKENQTTAKPAPNDQNKFPTFSSTFSKPSEGSPVSSVTTPTMVPKSTFSFPSSTTFPISPPGSNTFASVPKLDNAFKFSTKPASQQHSPPAPGGLDMSTLNFSTRPGLSITPTVTTPPSESKSSGATSPTVSSSLSFGKTSSPSSMFGLSGAQPVATAAAAGLSLQSLFGKSSGTPAVSSSADKAAVSMAAATTTQATITSTALSAAATGTSAAPTSVFGNSSMFGGLSASIAPTSSFGLAPSSTAAMAAVTTTTSAAPASTPAATSATAATTTVAATPTLSFGGLSTSTPSSTPGFAGMLGATASLSFGTPSSTGASITPAFGKSTTPATANIFGSTAAATGAASPASATSIFGGKTSDGSTAVSSASSPFGGTTSTATTTTTTTSVFGGMAAATSTPSMFGGQTAVSSSTENSFFSTKPAATATTVAATAAAPTASIFGGSATTTPSAGSMFGSSGTSAPAFGSSTATIQQSNVFGANSTTPSSGTSLFGGTPATSSVFGGSGSALATPIFGASSATPAASTTATTATNSVFGGAASTGSIFGGATAAPATGGSVFGASTTPTSSIFGGASATSTSTTTPAPAGSIFGASAASPPAAGGNIFGAAAASPTSPSGGSVFGGPPALGGGTSMFGGAVSSGGMGSSSVFGQPSAFGAKPAFGSPPTDFGAAKTGFGSTGFGSPPAFGAAPTAGFGNPSGFGSTSPLGASTSPSKVFGSSTFEALGAQSGGLSFGSLAQKTPEPQKPQAFQGSSSFSSWR
ncbi:nuclear pore complex protein Nup214 [Nasonia vitripennis]|uniref:Nucleoporin Nup159/Nup146 N-terminal domain-containing protein n=1 Tax=Nasonia vitripennis TaxID=7425 RepID=A0A7M7G792_NASVI|nr:nuclear pore complex protein Nup214 [Nasonia vitripennis]